MEVFFKKTMIIHFFCPSAYEFIIDRKNDIEKLSFTRNSKLMFVLKVNPNHEGGTLY